jgi:hypothetical protein
MHLQATSCLMKSPDSQAADIAIPQLVGQVYESAPVAERIRLLEHLLRPLGVLSLVAVAHGAFAKVWLWSRGQAVRVRPEDVQEVIGADVTALVGFVQQFSAETVDGLAQILAASPAMAGSALAALLVTSLLKRANARGDATQ